MSQKIRKEQATFTVVEVDKAKMRCSMEKKCSRSNSKEETDRMEEDAKRMARIGKEVTDTKKMRLKRMRRERNFLRHCKQTLPDRNHLS